MFRKMSLVGLMLILSANAALCSFIAPDSVLGGFSKCTIHYTTAKSELSPYELAYLNGKVDKTKTIFCEAIYDRNNKITEEVAKYSDGSPKQKILYKYDKDYYPLDISLYNSRGDLFLNQHFTKSNDTLKVKVHINSNSSDSLSEQSLVYDNSQKKIPHSTMLNNGQDEYYQSMYSFIRGSDTHISIYLYPIKNFRQIPLPGTPQSKYEYKYDNNGKITETLRTDPDGEKTTTFNKYDGQGRLIETSVLKSDGTKEEEKYYKYEDNGSKTEFENNIYGIIYLRFITRYDEKGRVYEIVESHPNGEQRSIITRKFDDENRIIEVTQNNPNDLEVGKRTFEYDEYGNMTKNIVYSPSNEPIKTIEYVYSK
ncbi:MAG: RHS repeat domain-containing protein [bacterium]